MAGDDTRTIRQEKASPLTDEMLSQLIQGSPIPTFVIDRQHTITHCNRAYERLAGVPARKIIGKPSHRFTRRRVLADFIVDGAPEEEIAAHYGTRYHRSALIDGAYEAEEFFPAVFDKGAWLYFTAAPLTDAEGTIIGAIETLQDVSREKRTARQNEAMLRISMALPRYPDLEDLLEFINKEVKDLLGTEGAIVVLLDEHKEELFVLGASYDDTSTQERVKEVRFSMDQLIAGRVIRTGRPMIVSDTSVDGALHEERDHRLGYKTRNLLLVPLQSAERTIGALCAINRKEGDFEKGDEELLSMVAATVALSVENARFSEELKKAYREVSSLNRAKDKAINHISHELKTPISVLTSCLKILERRLRELPDLEWNTTLERSQRNLNRILEIQYEAADIMQNKPYKAEGVLCLLLEQCADELEALVAQETGEGPVVERIRKRIREIFVPQESAPRELLLHEAARETLDRIRPHFSHRQVEILTDLQPAPPILLPPDVLQKVIEGLVKNAVENTPDEGKIEIRVRPKGVGAELLVHDYGVGISEEAQRRIFEGFFTTRDTLAYSSKRPYDFNAGGKGADLLRMKIFSERYQFRIDVRSTRCAFLPREGDVCHGRVSECPRCREGGGCHRSGATLFSVYFPPARHKGQGHLAQVTGP